MKIHHLQHVPFEGLGSMKPYLENTGHQLTSTHLYEDLAFPAIHDIDCLIIMGGPMGIYDEENYPWLKAEKEFIRKAVESGKTILGICLGAQLIADVLGAKVYKNKYREIGWFNIQRATEVNNTILAQSIAENLEAFHWHGDTFEIPEGAVPLGASDACKNQGFIIADRIIAFQFHLETTRESAASLIQNCGDEIDGSRYVQTETEMLSDMNKFDSINRVMFSVLQAMEKTIEF